MHFYENLNFSGRVDSKSRAGCLPESCQKVKLWRINSGFLPLVHRLVCVEYLQCVIKALCSSLWAIYNHACFNLRVLAADLSFIAPKTSAIIVGLELCAYVHTYARVCAVLPVSHLQG